MGIIRIYERSGKTKRQPGWAQKQAEYDAWLAKVNGMKTTFARTPPKKSKPAPKETTPSTTVSTFRPTSFEAFKGGGTKAVARPEHQYADNPELLERELKARERKFNVAPAYNKGGAMLCTDDMMDDLKKGLLRRR
jgi:hypothetical protein